MNIYDIAREAGVSIATISRVVNGKSTVSAKTREKVEAVLKKYSYVPDSAARSLANKSSRSVAVLADDISGFCCANIVRTVELELSRTGYTTILNNTGGTVQGIDSAIKSALARHVDAIIIIGMSDSANEVILQAAKTLPVVVVDNYIDSPGVYSVVCDEMYGMMLAVSHLVSKGRQNIIFVQDGFEGSYSAKKLTEGFNNGLAMNELEADDSIVTTERGFDGGFACAQSLLSQQRRFDGVICGDDTTAAGFVKCLRQNFLDIPEDVSIIGFHNTPSAQCAVPQLTSIDCRNDKLGAGTVGILSKLFADTPAERRVVVLPRLVVRESS
jgi:LacI family transcriptional regulator